MYQDTPSNYLPISPSSSLYLSFYLTLKGRIEYRLKFALKFCKKRERDSCGVIAVVNRMNTIVHKTSKINFKVYWFFIQISFCFYQINSNFNGPTPASFLVYFAVFSNTNLTEKAVLFVNIWTRIVRIEGEHADHLTTTRGLNSHLFYGPEIFREILATCTRKELTTWIVWKYWSLLSSH